MSIGKIDTKMVCLKWRMSNMIHIKQAKTMLEWIQQQHDEDHAYIEWLEETHRHLYPNNDIYAFYEKYKGIFAEEE